MALQCHCSASASAESESQGAIFEFILRWLLYVAVKPKKTGHVKTVARLLSCDAARKFATRRPTPLRKIISTVNHTPRVLAVQGRCVETAQNHVRVKTVQPRRVKPVILLARLAAQRDKCRHMGNPCVVNVGTANHASFVKNIFVRHALTTVLSLLAGLRVIFVKKLPVESMRTNLLSLATTV